ncbi:hypothetical protein FISHEDRAFT_62418 [Fistulina hepatica ATCC 64428]|nr:hypothetical protein FISHEDRAFT_62418 [Fistulina hepatica ATCC 64428]
MYTLSSIELTFTFYSGSSKSRIPRLADIIDFAPFMWRHIELYHERLKLESYREYLSKCVSLSRKRFERLTMGAVEAPVHASPAFMHWLPNNIADFSTIRTLRLCVSFDALGMLTRSEVRFVHVEDVELNMRIRIKCLCLFQREHTELLPFPTDELEELESKNFYPTGIAYDIMARCHRLKSMILDSVDYDAERDIHGSPEPLACIEHLDMTFCAFADSQNDIEALMHRFTFPNLRRLRIKGIPEVDDEVQELFDVFASESFEHLEELDLDHTGFTLDLALHEESPLVTLRISETRESSDALIRLLQDLSSMTMLHHVNIWSAGIPPCQSSDGGEAFHAALDDLTQILQDRDGSLAISFVSCLNDGAP